MFASLGRETLPKRGLSTLMLNSLNKTVSQIFRCIFWSSAFLVGFKLVLDQTMNTGYKPVRQFSLPAETVHHIWLPSRLSEILIAAKVSDSLGRKPFFTDNSLSRKQEIMDSLGESQI